MTHHRNFPLRATLGGAARRNGTTIQNASHVVALYKPAAASRRAMLVPVAALLTLPATGTSIALRLAALAAPSS
jgi:hypothetical protein